MDVSRRSCPVNLASSPWNQSVGEKFFSSGLIADPKYGLDAVHCSEVVRKEVLDDHFTSSSQGNSSVPKHDSVPHKPTIVATPRIAPDIPRSASRSMPMPMLSTGDRISHEVYRMSGCPCCLTFIQTVIQSSLSTLISVPNSNLLRFISRPSSILLHNF